MIGGFELLAEDLTPSSIVRKMLGVTTVADAEALSVSCTIADRCGRVEFFDPSGGIGPLRTALVAAILRRGELNHLCTRHIGFRPDRR